MKMPHYLLCPGVQTGDKRNGKSKCILKLLKFTCKSEVSQSAIIGHIYLVIDIQDLGSKNQFPNGPTPPSHPHTLSCLEVSSETSSALNYYFIKQS